VPSCVERVSSQIWDNLESRLDGDHPLADRDHVCVVMLPREHGALSAPAQGAADAAHLVRDDRLPISGATEDDSALAFPAGDSLCRRVNEERVIHRASEYVPKSFTSCPAAESSSVMRVL
jgi:hypothetical protein